MKTVVVTAVAALGLSACLTSYNRYKYDAEAGSPPVEPRPAGCNVDIVEDGQKVKRAHAKIGHIVLEWPLEKINEQGPDGAIKTLREAACENGAFIISDMRALTTSDRGLVYEATFNTLLGDDGKPVNPKLDKKPDPAPPPPVASGW